MAVRSFEIFRAGAHVAMDGSAHSYSETDLRRTAAGYNVVQDERGVKAPCVLGHTHDKSYGDVLALEFRDQSLYAVADIGPKLLDLVRSGAYKKVSASFFVPHASDNPAPGIWFLRHVGFLGAHPPAIKGLNELAFSETSSIDFSERAGNDTANGFEGAFAATAFIPGMGFHERIALASLAEARQRRSA